MNPELSESQQVFLFDAVGTILEPTPDVSTVYFQHGRSFGSRLTFEEVKQRFKTARQTLFLSENAEHETSSEFPDGVLVSNDDREREMWYQLVKAVFTDVPPIEDLFAALWEHFATPDNWKVFDDVSACWSALRAKNSTIAIASNFDSRLHAVVASCPPLESADWCFCSAEVGFRKPDQAFYRTIKTTIESELNKPLNVTFVGDDLEHDAKAPAAFGWQSIWLNRDGRKANTAAKQISSLDELLDAVCKI